MQELILYQKIYDFLLYIYPVIAKYPKFEKFALQTQTKNCVLDMLRCVIKANKSRTGKASKLYEADALLEELRMLFRLANDLSEGQKSGAGAAFTKYKNVCWLLRVLARAYQTRRHKPFAEKDDCRNQKNYKAKRGCIWWIMGRYGQ